MMDTQQMFTADEAKVIVSSVINQVWWGADGSTHAASVITKLAPLLPRPTRNMVTAEILESSVFGDVGSHIEIWVDPLAALCAIHTAEDLTAHVREYASMLHSEQTDKLGVPYTGHLEAVANGVPQDDLLAVRVAWLHDSLEDTEASEKIIRTLIGDEGLAAVKAITHSKNERRTEYYDRILSNPTARTVKLSDIAHNTDPGRLSGLNEYTRERLQTKYQIALEALQVH